MATYLVLGRSTSMASIGEAWGLTLETVDENGNPTDLVTPTVTVTRPDASTVSPAPVGWGQGWWTVVYTLAAAGRHTMHVSTPEDASDTAVYALGPTTAAGMPNANDCVHYMRESSWDTSAITSALAAEAQAQRDRCGERNPYPDSLREALLRRVQRNLAMRALPLAVNIGDADSGPTVLPGRDPEVRRLEGPWRKATIG